MPWVPISEARQTPQEAKQVRLQCPHCHGFAYADIPYYAPEGVNYETMRHDLIKKAIDEHRVVCAAGEATETRVYEIQYPRA
jgi:hypothetical protein